MMLLSDSHISAHADSKQFAYIIIITVPYLYVQLSAPLTEGFMNLLL